MLARGTTPLGMAKKAIKLLQDESGQVKVPITFVTNALNRNKDKADQIGGWFDLEVGGFFLTGYDYPWTDQLFWGRKIIIGAFPNDL